MDMSGNGNNKEQEKKNSGNLLLEWIKIIAAAVLLACFLNTCIIANCRVPSGSMEPAIMTGDRILGLRLSYKLGGEPERGDIVIFTHGTGPANAKTRLVKRVVGMPGETVDIRDHHIYINGSEKPLEESYLAEEMDSEEFHFEVPEDSYLMLGDNRNHSSDARDWKDPYVSKKEILAKVWIRYFPKPGILAGK